MTDRPRAVIVVTGSELVRGDRRDLNGPFLAASSLAWLATAGIMKVASGLDIG